MKKILLIAALAFVASFSQAQISYPFFTYPAQSYVRMVTITDTAHVDSAYYGLTYVLAAGGPSTYYVASIDSVTLPNGRTIGPTKFSTNYFTVYEPFSVSITPVNYIYDKNLFRFFQVKN